MGSCQGSGRWAGGGGGGLVDLVIGRILSLSMVLCVVPTMVKCISPTIVLCTVPTLVLCTAGIVRISS